MNIFLTGCAGFLGSALARELCLAGHRVVGLDSLEHGQSWVLPGLLSLPGFVFVRCDVRDRGRFAGSLKWADAVVHAAALVGAPLCERKGADEAVAVNADATEGIACRLSARQRLVYFCTNSGYGKCPGRLATEADPLRPLSAYGRSKAMGEAHALDHPNAVSLRLATVFGVSPRPRYDLLVNDFARRLVMIQDGGGGPLEVYEPGFVRNAVGVRDVTGAVLHCLGGGAGLQGAYNVALPGANLTKMGLALRVCGALGLPEGSVRPGLGSDPDGRDCGADSSRLMATGFRFLHCLDEGVLEAARLVRSCPWEVSEKWRNA